MKISCSLMIALLTVAGAAGVARASDNAYVCSVRVVTGFAKASDTAYPHSTQMKIEAKLTSQPYCQGGAAGTVTVDTPVLETVRSRRKVLDHITKVRNVWQAGLATFQVLTIASAQGAPLNQAITVATNVEEQPAKEFAFQAMRPASTTTPAAERVTGKRGNLVSGYVCLSGSKYQITNAQEMITVADVHNFSLSLFTKPFCLGKEVSRHQYEFGPAMRMSGKEADKLFQSTANMNASALMHAIDTMFVEAAMAGQYVIIEHTGDGMIASIELMARARDLAKEVKTIATPGQ